MELTYLDSGLDSLKKGFKELVEYEKKAFYYKSRNPDETRFLNLKDAILFTQHGIEILIKSIIHDHSEYLIFTQIDKHVKAAIKQKNERNLNSVFESELKHKIHTVNFLESIERLKIIPNIKMSRALENRLKELESYRNVIMHSEPYLNEYDINKTFEGLSDELDIFFSENIGEKYKMISGYDTLVKYIDTFKDFYEEKGLELKIKTYEILSASLKKAKITIGGKEVKRITDIKKCSTFLTSIFDSELVFGTDLYNGFCSGSVNKIIRKKGDVFALYTSDNDTFYEFKLKSIIIYIPQLNDKLSPIVFIESDNLDFNSIDYDNLELSEFDGIESIEYLKIKSSKKHIYQVNDISAIHKDENITNDDYENYFRFFTKGLFCFLNVQGLVYNEGYKKLIWKEKKMDGKELEVGLRDILTK